jgi:hypothetical protein
MSNARILAQLEKFDRDINAETMSLNQRVPGSSPGAPTKLFKHSAVAPRSKSLAEMIGNILDVVQVVAGEACDLWSRRSRDRASRSS